MRKVSSIGIMCLLVMISFLSGSFLLTQNVKADYWQIETIYEGGVCLNTNLVVDSEDNIHIVFHEDVGHSNKHAEKNGNNWIIENVCTVPDEALLCIDSTNKLHACYNWIDLMYGNKTDDEWNFTSVDTDQSTGHNVKMAIDSYNRPHIIYPFQDQYKYVRWNGSDWEMDNGLSELLSGYSINTISGFDSFILDSNDKPHCSFRTEDKKLIYAHNNSEGWTMTIVEDSKVYYSALAIDDNNFPHITYASSWPPSPWPTSINYTKWTGSDWSKETVDTVYNDDDYDLELYGIGSISFILDSLNNPHICYDYNYVRYEGHTIVIEESALKYVYWMNNEWHKEFIEYNSDPPLWVGYGSSIVVDSFDNIHICYWNNPSTQDNDGILKYARREKTVITLPSRPLNLQAIPGDGQVTLSWNVPSSDGNSTITNYKIYRDSTTGGETPLTTVGNLLTYSDTGVTNNQTYYYKVSAINSIGEGPMSDEVSATPIPGEVQWDSDDDGLNDTWEIEHFGDLTQSGGGDFDEDGFTNLQEYQADTDPTDSTDYPPDDGDGDGGDETPGFELTTMLVATTLAFVIITTSRRRKK